MVVVAQLTRKLPADFKFSVKTMKTITLNRTFNSVGGTIRCKMHLKYSGAWE